MPDFPPVPGVTHRFVDVDGLRIHVAEAGPPDGEPIVLQHGWPQHWWIWRHVIPELATRYRVLCPDLRGHGWSDAPRGADYSKERLATDLLGVLDALELPQVALVGHDWGGFAGFLACLRAPERFRGYVALSILHPWPAQERPSPKRIASISYQFVLAAPLIGRQVIQRTGFIDLVLQKGRVAGAWGPGERAVYSDRFREADRAAATSALYRTFLTRELRPLLSGAYADRHLAVPARLVVGEEDRVFRGNPLGGYEKAAPELVVEHAPGLGHFLPEEDPAVVLRAIAAQFG